MFGEMLTVLKTVGSSLKITTPVQIGSDDQIQMIKTPTGPVDLVLEILGRIIRPALVILIVWMFYWFSINPELADKWMNIVVKIPGQMWDNIMIILGSVGISGVVRSVKTPHNTPSVVVKTPPGDGAAKPELDDDDDTTQKTTVTVTPETHPTLAAWKAQQGK